MTDANHLAGLLPTQDTYTRLDYQLLGRLQQDCEYFLGNGNRAAKHLWAGNVSDQIKAMRELYARLPERPSWISLGEIARLEKAMLCSTTDTPAAPRPACPGRLLACSQSAPAMLAGESQSQRFRPRNLEKQDADGGMRRGWLAVLPIVSVRSRSQGLRGFRNPLAASAVITLDTCAADRSMGIRQSCHILRSNIHECAPIRPLRSCCRRFYSPSE